MSGALPQGTWRVDPARSRVAFRVKHLGVSAAEGHFGSFAGTLEAGPAGIAASGTVRVESVRTGDGQRDSLLASRLFFDAERHPEIAFASSAAAELDGGLRIDGELTIRGRACPVRLEVEVLEQDEDALRLSARAELSRSDYELRFRGPMSAGNRAVGDRVSIELEIFAVAAG